MGEIVEEERNWKESFLNENEVKEKKYNKIKCIEEIIYLYFIYISSCLSCNIRVWWSLHLRLAKFRETSRQRGNSRNAMFIVKSDENM